MTDGSPGPEAEDAADGSPGPEAEDAAAREPDDAVLGEGDGPARTGIAEPEDEVFPPTLREVMIRPRWIALLLLCLVVAGVFAWLGQWQLARAITTDPLPPGVTEEVRPIDEVVEPGAYLPEPLVGQKVAVSGWWIDTDFLIVGSRFNDGAEGYWVTGQFRLWDGEGGFDQGDPVSLAVAVGWAPTLEAAQQAAADLEEQTAATDVDVPAELTGRLVSDEGTSLPPRDGDPWAMDRMSPAMLLGQWNDVEDLSVYRAYLVSDEPWGGLEAISSPAPEESGAVNWLNLFYAAEWAIFAGFAFYLWYRLARDQWEREVEDLEDVKADAAAAASGPAGDDDPASGARGSAD
ncbi:SURF1 family cytochrome oxidase biogenesis protein [Microbacter sp. GSS18]|nr:SURF1 family cytochrome oxidase biogenesis protein [Microbacter sp. GSS18]